MKDDCFLLQRPLMVDVVYCHVSGDQTHRDLAARFIESWQVHDPQFPGRLIVVANGGEPNSEVRAMFRPLDASWFYHDDSGWDIGAYQAYCRQSSAHMAVFLGGSSYLRRAGWLKRMVDVFLAAEGVGLWGSCGNLGVKSHRVEPHIRTTGFWCSPQVMNAYPHRIVSHAQRYPFEHGKSGLTSWAMAMHIPVQVVDFSGIYDYPHWNDGPQGYHQNMQIDLLVGDRMTRPPFFNHP